MKERDTGKNRKKEITLLAQPAVPEGPALNYQGLPPEALREMISISSRFFRISAGLSITPN